VTPINVFGLCVMPVKATNLTTVAIVAGNENIMAARITGTSYRSSCYDRNVTSNANYWFSGSLSSTEASSATSDTSQHPIQHGTGQTGSSYISSYLS
jgi:hypothetical protein